MATKQNPPVFTIEELYRGQFYTSFPPVGDTNSKPHDAVVSRQQLSEGWAYTVFAAPPLSIPYSPSGLEFSLYVPDTWEEEFPTPPENPPLYLPVETYRYNERIDESGNFQWSFTAAIKVPGACIYTNGGGMYSTWEGQWWGANATIAQGRILLPGNTELPIPPEQTEAPPLPTLKKKKA